MKHAKQTMLVLFLTLFTLAFWNSAHAETSGVIGDGGAASCTETALNTALAAGGEITFNCGDAPHTIVFTEGKTLNVDTTIDGGGRITFSGSNAHDLFVVSDGTALTLRNLDSFLATGKLVTPV